MDLSYSPADETFRTEIRGWLETNLPAGWFDKGFEMTAEQRKEFNATWPSTLFEGGWICATWPIDYGGKGLSTMQGVVLSEEFARAKAPLRADFFGDTLVGPTILQWGTEEQKKHFLPTILNGTMSWCQGFSEPNSGSDLASLKTSAVLDGDEWIINGQKVWTTQGHHADYCFLLTRTDPDAPKHKGISYLLVPMNQPGVEVRPLREMTGRAMFNEVFIDEARVPAANIIGGLNNGWAVANTTLMVERASLGSGSSGGLGVALPGSLAGHLERTVGEFVVERTGSSAGSIGGGTVKLLTGLARHTGCINDPTVRQGLAELHTLTEVNKFNMLRARSGQRSTQVEGNLAKLLTTHTLRRAREIGNQIIGAQGMLWGPDSLSGGIVQELTVFSPGPSIYGGTDQVQRNIVSERGLGLPKEPGDFRTTPYRDLPKNG